MKKFIIYLLSIMTSFCIYSEHIIKEMAISFNKIKDLDLKILAKLSYTNTDFLLILIITIFFINFYSKYKDIPKKKTYNILSFIFALFLTFGFSYNVIGNYSLATGNLLLIIISVIKTYTYYYFLSTVINLLASYLKTKDLFKITIPKTLTKFRNYYEEHPYKTSLIVILLAWLPYIISFYPTILSPDPSNQILQYFSHHTHYVEGVKLLNDNVLITNHHPVFHTFILGGFAKIGYNLGNINFGLFLFTCFQLFIVLSAMIYSLVYLKKIKVPFIYRFILLILYSLVPVFPLYALSAVKDTIFGALLVFYIIEVHKIITTKYEFKNYFIFGLLMLFMMLVRNNGIYIVILSIISLIAILKEKRLAIIITILSTTFIYTAHNKILLPIMNITPGSIREMLSVPFQQTARYVKYYDKEMTNEEKEIIDKILGYKTLKDRYKPNIADPVKNEFNKNTTTEDLIKYFVVWTKGLLKHPGTYINATVNTVYGYFYPNTSNWYVYHNYDKRLIKEGLDYHYNKLRLSRTILSSYASVYPYIPIIGAEVNIGFNNWIYMFLLAYLITEQKKRLIPLIMPAFILLLTCVVGPVNTYFRYMFPLVLTLPLLIGIIYNEKAN